MFGYYSFEKLYNGKEMEAFLSAGKLTHGNESHPHHHEHEHHFRRPYADGHVITHGLHDHRLLGHHVDVGGDIRGINTFSPDHSGHHRHRKRPVGSAGIDAMNTGGIEFIRHQRRFEGDQAAVLLGVDPHSIYNDSGHGNRNLHTGQDDIFVRHDPGVHDHIFINPYDKHRPDWHHYSPTQPFLGMA